MKICNNFFSGFCFSNECELFLDYLEEGEFIISGFSYGAIKAFKTILSSDKRVDKLQLFSPAFFQNKDEKFKRMQLIYFEKNEEPYIKAFLGNVNFAFKKDVSKYYKKGTIEELEELLYFVWQKDDLQKLVDKGVKIEVFLGEKDKIINSLEAKEFFKEFATVYYFKEKGHLL